MKVPRTIEATFTGTATVAASEGKKRLPRISILAYTGVPIEPNLTPPLPHPIIIDLAGVELKTQRLPILHEHKADQVVGHSNRVENDGAKLNVEGVVSGAGKAAREVVAQANNEFPFQASIGATLGGISFVRKDQRVTVNNRTFPGPVYVAKRSRMKEVSVVCLPADDETFCTIRAKKHMALRKNKTAAVIADVDDDQDDTQDDAGADAGRDEATEARRVTALKAAIGSDRMLLARAIYEEWEPTDSRVRAAVKAADLHDSLPRASFAPSRNRADAPASSVVLEAACAMTANLSNLEEVYDERTLQAAKDRFGGSITLHEMFNTAAAMNGYQGPGVRADTAGVFRAVFSHSMQAAQFSTVSLPQIFSNVANKFLLEGFMSVERNWAPIAAIRPANDFKTMTSYRLTGDATFEEIAPDGEIPHGTLGEESFTNKAKSYGKMYGITFQDVRNDDMGALTSVPRKLGRGGALKINDVFWTEFLDNAAFFADPSQNYLKGATTTLTGTGLGLALKKFRDKVDADGKPLAIEPRFLLVPPALEVPAKELLAATSVNTGGSSTEARVPAVNIWADQFTLLVSAYLGNESYPGADPLAYYLTGDPANIPVIEIAFLDGKQQPQVETAEADFNTLGVLMRGTLHFGVAKQDPRGGVKVKGAA